MEPEVRFPNEPAVLVVDDDPQVLEALVGVLRDTYNVISASSGEQAVRTCMETSDVALIVMDIKMEGVNGVEAARQIKQSSPEVNVIFHTGFPGDYDEAEIDSRDAPFDYILKGKSLPRLLRSVRNAFLAYKFKSRAQTLEYLNLGKRHGLVGRSAAMEAVYYAIERIAQTRQRVVILGETGTGKELAARAIHELSGRDPLGIFNCNQKDPSQIESELFGHTKGAFSSVLDRVGLVEYANGGTLFLDEIGDLDMTSQAKLLRVIERGEYQKLGSPEIRKADLRVVCATNRDLPRLIEEGGFREDLWYRLRGAVINMPPLRARKEDIPSLVEHFLGKLHVEYGCVTAMFDDAAMDALMDHDWPGNVRELLDVVETAVTMSPSSIVSADDLSTLLEAPESSLKAEASLSEMVQEFERTTILKALVRNDGNISKAARFLGMDRANLHKKIKRYNITPV